MPDKLEEFVRETIDELLATLAAKERLKGLSPEERFVSVHGTREMGLDYRALFRPLLLYQLFKLYSQDPDTPETLKEYARKAIDEIRTSPPIKGLLERLSHEKQLEGLPAEERLKGLSAEERLKGLPVEEVRKHLSPEERLKGLSADEVLKALPPETLEALGRKLKANGPSAKPQ
jgi:hypothetical protein